MEGVVLYIMLVRVFAQIDWKYYTGFALMSYGKTTVVVCFSYSVEISLPGGPLLYMALCIPLGLARTDKWSYGSDDV